jgi:CubicO group peptidase (beta-lactamase class C family)
MAARNLILIGTLAAAIDLMAAAQVTPQQRSLSARLEAVCIAEKLPAIAGASFRSSGVIEIAASGVRRIGDTTEVTTNDLWHVGSITKSFTSALVGKFVERKELSWTSTLGDLLGPSRAGKFAPVTLVNLLSHRAGLPPNVPPALGAELRTSSRAVTEQRQRIADAILAGDPASAPGERYLYSNLDYIVAGAILETKTGRSWEELVRSEVLVPLELTSVGFGAPGTAAALTQPRGHRQPARPGAALVPIEPPAADNPPYLGPAGTMHMTITDLARWGQEHLRGERGVDGLLRADTFRRLHEPPQADAIYALGWVVRKEGDHRVIWHNGSNTLWYAMVAFDPDGDLGIAIATNGSIAAAKAIDTAAAEFLTGVGRAFRPGDAAGAKAPAYATAKAPADATAKAPADATAKAPAYASPVSTSPSPGTATPRCHRPRPER